VRYRLTPLFPALLTALLTGCATLPSSGPTSTDIVRDRAGADLLGFKIVDIDSPASVDAASQQPEQLVKLRELASQARVDTVGPGDVLGITIYEVGTGLFSGSTTNINDAGATFNTAAQSAGLAGVTVDREGAISLPYIGRVEVAGLTSAEIQKKVQDGLRRMSQSPQALVTVRSNITNTVVVLGVVARPGRQQLTLIRDRLLDAIAEAGGTGQQPQEDMIVRFTRGGRTVEQLLSLIQASSPDDLVLVPGDRIQVVRRPQSFTVFGATRVAQVNFENPSLTLAEALARAGGPSDDRADPRAIFIFRYARGADGTPLGVTAPGGTTTPTSSSALPPTIYRLDMMRPASYFLAQRFPMRDKDVVYIANARANRPAKLINIINQLFTPIVTARVLTQ
jgi:polysaccharide export outer membrane protein